ncbi:hypothetical protein J5N97_007848 [Dioscorea zingiberensis]|uniref:Uncharacterized protein n=1 Tax=Dioscorea zingiberensis TaxID=325984 RepID=A0A9D5HW29_9LILI|nr:hypothetical protein J5N97_007848 [Dioscorea zingiberensis]
MEKSRSMPEYSSSFSGRFGGYEEAGGGGGGKAYSFNGPSGKSREDGFASSSDPELKRKRRVASYNLFTVEGKLKSSVRSSWLGPLMGWARSSWTWSKKGISFAFKSISLRFRNSGVVLEIISLAARTQG